MDKKRNNQGHSEYAKHVENSFDDNGSHRVRHLHGTFSGNQIRPGQFADSRRNGSNGQKSHTGNRKKRKLIYFFHRLQYNSPAVGPQHASEYHEDDEKNNVA